MLVEAKSGLVVGKLVMLVSNRNARELEDKVWACRLWWMRVFGLLSGVARGGASIGAVVTSAIVAVPSASV